MADSNLIELFNDIGYTKSDNINRYLKIPQQTTMKTGVFLDKNGQPTDRFLQSIKAENPSLNNTKLAYLQEDFAVDDCDSEDNELELDLVNSNSRDILKGARKSPNVVEYSTMVSSASKALIKRSTSPPNKKLKKTAKSTKKKKSGTRLSYDEPIITIPTTSKYNTLINNKLEKMIYNNCINDPVPETTVGDNNIIQTLKLRVKGQLHTIRVLESQLNDSLHLLEARNIEVADLKKRLQTVDRKDRVMVRDEYKHLQTLRSDDNLQKYKIEIDTLTSRLTEEQNRRMQSESRNKTYREHIEKYKTINSESENRIKSLEQSITELQHQLKRNKREGKDTSTEILTYQSVIEKLKLSCEQFEKNNKKLNASLNEAHREIGSLKEIHSRQKLDLESTQDQLRRVSLELDILKDIQNTRAVERRVLQEESSSGATGTTKRRGGSEGKQKVRGSSTSPSGVGSGDSEHREMTTPSSSHIRRDRERSIAQPPNSNSGATSYRSRSAGSERPVPGKGAYESRFQEPQTRQTASLGRYVDVESGRGNSITNASSMRVSEKPQRPSSAGVLSNKYIVPSPRPEIADPLHFPHHPYRPTATSTSIATAATSDLPRRLIDRHIDREPSHFDKLPSVTHDRSESTNIYPSSNTYHNISSNNKDPSTRKSPSDSTHLTTRTSPSHPPQQVLDAQQDANGSYYQHQQPQQHNYDGGGNRSSKHETSDYLMSQSQSFLQSRQQQQQQQGKASSNQVIHIRGKTPHSQNNSQKIIIQKVTDIDDYDDEENDDDANTLRFTAHKQSYRKPPPPPSSPNSDTEVITRRNKSSNRITTTADGSTAAQHRQGGGVPHARPVSASSARPSSLGNNNPLTLITSSRTKLSPNKNSNNVNVIKTSSKFDRLQKMYERVTGSVPAKTGWKDSDSDSEI